MKDLNIENLDEFIITSRNRILRAWHISTELVRDCQQYSHEFEQKKRKLSTMFAEFAQNEAGRASRLLMLLRGYDEECKG